ncbi:MAG TPA: hypothetical protein VF447_05340 [Terriglobales bacterium]
MPAPCERCNWVTNNPENEYGEFICDDCEQNAAEAAWERFCGDFYGGSDPLTIREKQIHDWKNRP